MKYSECVKPLSYVKAHASELIKRLNAGPSDPIIITQNGEATAVLMGVKEYETMQEGKALRQLLAQRSRQIDEGKHRPAEEVFKELRARIDSQ